jgi:hypothetical protein
MHFVSVFKKKLCHEVCGFLHEDGQGSLTLFGVPFVAFVTFVDGTI